MDLTTVLVLFWLVSSGVVVLCLTRM